MKKIIIGLLALIVIVVCTFYFIVRTQIEKFSFTPSNSLKIEMNLKRGNVTFYSSKTDHANGVISYSGNKPQILNTDSELNISDMSSVVKKVEIIQSDNFQSKSLAINLGSGNITLPLRTSAISNIEVNAGASNIELTVPGTVSSTIKFTVGAGNLHIVVPETEKLSGIRIIPTAGTNFTSDNLTGFIKVGNNYETKNFDEKNITSTIYLSVGSATFSIDSVK